MAAQPGIACAPTQLKQSPGSAVTKTARTTHDSQITIRDYAPRPAARAMPSDAAPDLPRLPGDLVELSQQVTLPNEPRDGQCQQVTCHLDEIHPHPSYARHQLRVPACKLSALAERGDLAFQEPLVITQDGTIIDGHARWELARLQGRQTLRCIEYELSGAEALHWLLQRHRRSNGLNAFVRILLALELEPWFKEKARSNLRAGGQNQGLSKLAEAERLNVRSEVAAAAGARLTNVGKVKKLIMTAAPEILQALLSGEISIHRAWLWSKASREEQREALRLYQSERGVKKKIRFLISRHRSKRLPTVPDLDLGNLVRRLSALASTKLGPVGVALLKAPGRTVFLTEELFRALGLQKE